MTEDVHPANYFVDLTLYRCRMKDSCYFAAKNELDFEEHAKDAHPHVEKTLKSFEKIIADELSPGTFLLKCQLCDFLIGDNEVDDFWKRHYTASDILNICTWQSVAREQGAATFPELSLLARKPKSASSARKC